MKEKSVVVGDVTFTVYRSSSEVVFGKPFFVHADQSYLWADGHIHGWASSGRSLTCEGEGWFATVEDVDAAILKYAESQGLTIVPA